MLTRLAIPIATLLIALPSTAIDLSPGDVLVTGTPDGQPAGLYHVDPTTEVATLIRAGSYGDFSIVDQTIFALAGSSVFAIDAKSGGQTVVSSGGLLTGGVGIAAPSIDRVFVLQPDPVDPFAPANVIAIDAGTGDQSVLTEGLPYLGDELFRGVVDLEVSADGNLLALIYRVFSSVPYVIKISSNLGVQTMVSNFPNSLGQGATGLSVSTDGDIYISSGQHKNSSIGRHDPATGVTAHAGNLLVWFYPSGNSPDVEFSDLAIQRDGFGYAVRSGASGGGSLFALEPTCEEELHYCIRLLQNVTPAGDEVDPIPLSVPILPGHFGEVQVVPEICAVVGGLDCADDDDCTVDSCDPALGCVHTEDPHPSCAGRVNTAATRKCTVSLAKKALLASGVLGKQNQDSEGCIKDFGKERLGALTPDQCILDDRRQRVSKAEARATQVDQDKCSDAESTPAYAYAGSAAANQFARDESMAMTEDLLGAPLADLLATTSTDRDEQACQLHVAKRTGNLLEEMVKAALNEENEALKTSAINSSAELAPAMLAAIDADAKGRIAKRRGVLDTKLTKRCVDKGVVLADAFGGACAGEAADVQTFGNCIDARARCHACRALSGVHGFAFTCDGFDDGDGTNGSCL